MAVIWLPAAKEDFHRLFLFLKDKNPKAAQRLAECIKKGIDQLNRFPKSGRPLPEDSPSRDLFLPFGAGHYVLRYRVTETDIVVIRVWHSRESRG